LIKQAIEGSSNFETLETLVRDTSLRIGAGILETMINSDTNDCNPTFIHPNGTVMNLEPGCQLHKPNCLG